MDIRGHAAIVTGGASGLGAATARMLAEAGAKVAIFDVNQKAAAEVAIDINGIAITCDVTSAAATEAAFAKAAVTRYRVLERTPRLFPARCAERDAKYAARSESVAASSEVRPCRSCQSPNRRRSRRYDSSVFFAKPSSSQTASQNSSSSAAFREFMAPLPRARAASV